jgi:hypothetical protein
MPMIHPHMTFKTERIKARYKYLSPTSQEIAYEMGEWCEERKIPCLITETVTTKDEDFNLKRVSASHRCARAWDISVRGWSVQDRKDFTAHFTEKFLHLAAISTRTMEPTLIVFHDSGHGPHLHVQVSSLYAVYDPLKNAPPSDA